MDNYEGAFESGEAQPTEDSLTKSVEQYSASIPSFAFLGVAIGAMMLSLALQLAGRGKWGNFIAQWAPTWLIIGKVTIKPNAATTVATPARPYSFKACPERSEGSLFLSFLQILRSSGCARRTLNLEH